MEIIVNGKPRDISESISLLTLLDELNLNPETTIVELNGEVFRKDTYIHETLNEGDRVELVRLVGGG